MHRYRVLYTEHFSLEHEFEKSDRTLVETVFFLGLGESKHPFQNKKGEAL